MTGRRSALLTVVLALILSTTLAGSGASPTLARGNDVCPEPNDDLQNACFLGSSSDALGFISSPEDVDTYRVEVLDFNTRIRIQLADIAYRVVLVNWNGDPIATSTDQVGLVIDALAPLPGAYYLLVDSPRGLHSDGVPYRIKFRPIYPTVWVPRTWFNQDFRAGPADLEAQREIADFSRSGGRLTMTFKQAGTPRSPLWARWWAGTHPGNFIFVSDARLTAGDNAGHHLDFGVPLGGTTDQERYSVIVDHLQKLVSVVRYANGEGRELQSWTRAETIGPPGSVVRTVVTVEGETLWVNVNGRDVARLTGVSVSAGLFAVGAVTWGSPATVHIDNVMVTTTESPSGGARPGAAPGPGTPPAPPQGEVLFADDFDDPSAGRMPRESGAPADYSLAYLDGEYQLRIVNPTIAYLPTIYLPGTYSDATIAVDARLVGETQGRYISIGCRRQPDRPTGYRLLLDPTGGMVRLTRIDDQEITALADWQPAAAVRRGSARNRLELTCVGTSISASVNGVRVMSAEDGRYREGYLLIGASNFTGTTGLVDARFDNLVATRP